ncbi:CHASE2 domain-containing serine/threonine-protein kinase [Moorena sp. SIO4A5]|uniref:CHASE2 domain-containing serine/threonine-protein kinase n=1 Tax=Moorena sp. SIO4A5 TaxID=2607838 RepID=UPI0013C57979|nr:CHASE2 domain-containing serine/threonine-protein kinase [Moorena sp. SIO4A5]NEO23562.1 CHASE2 domain-containing protein [Moorena sp. SIO4A5]
MSAQLVKVATEESPNNSKLSPQAENPSPPPPKPTKAWSRLKRLGEYVGINPALIGSLAVTGLMLGSKHLGMLQFFELKAFDRMIELRPALPPDDRLLVVEVTEPDLKGTTAPGGSSIKDAVMYEVLQKLEQHQPAVIGVDIFRDSPVEPGHGEFSELLQSSDRIIPICYRGQSEASSVAAPPKISQHRVGFVNLLEDPDGIVRRAPLFFDNTSDNTSIVGCTTRLSFGFQLARSYLEQRGIKPENISRKQIKLGKTVYKKISPTAGGYQKGDTGGYQILLNYRSADHLADTVTLTKVLNEEIEPDLVKDRIVLIGMNAPSIKDDDFLTPYSFAQKESKHMQGVMIHGQIVSQLLSGALGEGRAQFWFWSEWTEGLWIWGWTLIGGVLVGVSRNTRQLVLSESIALGILVGTSYLLFLNSGWIPVVAPALALILSGTGVMTYTGYKAKQESIKAEQERRKIEAKAQEQEQNLALLQALLKEKNETTSSANTKTIPIPQTDLSQEDATAIWNPTAGADSDGTSVEYRPQNNLLAGRYQTKRVLGSGGFGLVHLAEDTQRPGSPQCVVKQLKPARSDPQFLKIARRLFSTEADILEILGNHLKIPRLLAYFEEDQVFYLVEEYIPGQSLSDELPVDKRLGVKEVADILKDILEILVFIHKYGVIHRDIKPGNIIRRQTDGQLVLIDFGAVKQIKSPEQSEEKNDTVAIGSRGYAPPEQLAGHPSFNSDIYALGMIGIQGLTGIRPYHLPISPETGEVIWRNLADVPEEFAQIIEKMVSYHFADRYQSAEVILQDFSKVIGG